MCCLLSRLGGADGKACCTRCCVSCVDCAPVVCCCLEIRLVSKYSTDKSRSVSESSVNQSREMQSMDSKDMVKATSLSFGAKGAKSKKEASKHVLSTVAVVTHTGCKPTPKKVQKTIKPNGDVIETNNTKLKETTLELTRKLPPPPLHVKVSLPSQQTSAKVTHKRKQSVSSELREVPVIQNSIPLHFLGRGHNDPDLLLGLPQHDDLISLSVNSNASMSNIRVHMYDQLEPGTILDGSGTHRSSVMDSVYSNVPRTPRSQGQSLTLTSPRPLPVPHGR
ncbi:uncharacterized protein LOC127856337 [Dreissena polymorpha]|nr:uncharacterized protein LOC127856337 [Dreissena polymorpha]